MECSVHLCVLSICCWQEIIKKAIASNLRARADWEKQSLQERSDIFLRAADLIAKKYRLEVIATTMLGQVSRDCAKLFSSKSFFFFFKKICELSSDCFIIWKKLIFQADRSYVTIHLGVEFTLRTIVSQLFFLIVATICGLVWSWPPFVG